jgi:hypothetical protein
MLGNSALSLLPHIVYDHDYPLIMNIYADSLFGIAGCLIIVLFVLRLWTDGGSDAAPRWIATLTVPGLFMFAFNYTAELDALIMVATVAAVAVFNMFSPALLRWRAIATTAVFALAALAGAFGGGALAGRVAGGTATDTVRGPFWEQDASSARMSVKQPAWWYVPFIIPGFSTGFGNLPVPTAILSPAGAADPADMATRAISDSVNARLIDRFHHDTSKSWFRYINLMYLVELRSVQAVQVLWWPLLGVAGLGVLVARGLVPAASSARLRPFWFMAASSFAIGLAVVFFANAVGGNALFWKWALTRAFEPGLCLATVSFVLLVDCLTSRLGMPTAQRWIWSALVAFMSFPTLVRIFVYPSFNG